ncbi:RHS repeat-associated core domain-containing protein [Mariniluteicoccus flavus]
MRGVVRGIVGVVAVTAVLAGSVVPAGAAPVVPVKAGRWPVVKAMVPAGTAPRTAGVESETRKAARAMQPAAPAKGVPVAGTTTVDLTTGVGRGDGLAVADGRGVAVGPVTAPVTQRRRLPVPEGPTPATVEVSTVDPAIAARLGVERLVTLTGEGPVTAKVEAPNSSGGVAGRSRLVRLPACALTTPEVASCQVVEPVGSVVEEEAGSTQLVATLTLRSAEAMVLAVAADAGGGAGNFGATSLSPTGSWSAGGSTGDFAWSYPMETPKVAGSPAAGVSVAYSSQAMDGQSSATNNQPSWVGEGWESTQGFVERSYKACADDQAGGSNASVKTGDLCWFSDNFTVSFGAHSGELVQDGTSSVWRLRRDDGSRFEHLFGAYGNGDDNNEYWKMTTPDGMQYWFGLGKPNPNGQATNSTWTVPVFGNQPGEPCYTATYANGSCVQAWRWNLDHIVDTHQGSLTVYYTAETNKYGRNNNAAPVTYTRGGFPNRIEYGQTGGQEHTSPAPARVMFEVAERCLPTAAQTCAEANLTATTKAAWPDVPFDRICAAATCTTSQTSPAFFTRKRLAQVRTEVHNGTSFEEVEHWNLTHTFPATGTNQNPSLWLAQVTHGAPGMPDDPSVVFSGTAMPNRVEGISDSLGQVWGAYWRFRVTGIDNGMGGETLVTYSGKDCAAGNMPVPETNGRRCYPIWWTPTGETQPRLQWFHKYVVTQVNEYDRSAASSGHKTTSYDYRGGAGWGWNDSPLTKDAERTWSRYVGYADVSTQIGDPGDPANLRTDTRFFRGLNGDRLNAAGGAKSVALPDSQGGTAVDHRGLQGAVHETFTFNGPTGPEVGGTITGYTILPAKAVSPAGIRAEKAVATHTKSRQKISTGTRTTETFTRFDSEGYPDQTEDLGDTATAADDACTRTTYARNPAAHQLSQPATTQTRAVACGGFDTLALTPENLLADTRTYYDNLPLGQIGKGDITRAEAVTSLNAGQRVYTTVGTTTVDAIGRATASTDVLGRTSTTSYVPAGRGIVTEQATTSPDPDGAGPLAAHTGRMFSDRRLGVPTRSVAAGGEVTEAVYDGYARVTGVWLPGRDRATQTPSTTFEYTVRPAGPNAVTTKVLLPNGTSYATSTTLSDGLGRPIQEQAQSQDQAVDANGNVSTKDGRVVASVGYDSRGLATVQRAGVFAWGLPDTTYQHIDEATMPAVTKTVVDGAGRPTKATLFSKNVEKWSTSTVHEGDRTHVTPPAGGTATTTITDADGNTTAVRSYTGAPLSTAFDEATYTYTPSGKVKTHTDHAGNTWTHTYDLLGRETSSTDPDAGTGTKSYDLAGQLLSATNGNNQTVGYTYDQLGRKTSLRDGSPTGTVLASWEYDTLKAGQLTSSSRWIDGKPITTKVTAYDTASRPTGATITVPEIPGWVETPLAKTYTTAHTYTPNGQPATSTLTGYGPLTYEKFTHYYDALGRASGLGGRGSYVGNTIYNGEGQVMQLALGNTLGQTSWQTYAYDDTHTRLTQSRLDREVATTADVVVDYTRNPAGAITKLATSTPETGAATDTQCFTTDHLQRLTRAWTPGSGDCTPAPTTTGLGGPAPYWQDWTFDKAGNRLSELSHAASGDTTRTWTVPGTGAKPHQATAQTTTSPAGTVSSPITYDPAGNTTTRTTTAKSVNPATTAQAQTLAWNAEGRLTQVVQGGQTTRFAYHTDGSRLIRRDDTTTVVSLGDTELTLTRATNTVTAQRYIQYAGQTIAMRTGPNIADVHTLFSDVNNTANWTINNATSTIQTRRTLPYGTPRGADPASWAPSRGFVQGLNDTTLGLIRVGARDYDPTTGRFLSPDPIIDLTAPTQWNPYHYGNSNPIDHPDPTGLRPDDYTPEMYNAELTARRNGERDWWQAAYRTPSGRAGGQSYKNAYGTRRYDELKRITHKYERLYRSTPRNRWSSHDRAQSEERQAADVQKQLSDQNARVKKAASDVWRSVVDTFTSAFLKPMTGAQINAAACGYECPIYMEMLLTDPAFQEQQQAQATIAVDMWATIFLGGPKVSLGKAANSVRSAAPSTLTRAEVLRGRASQRTVNEIAESMRVNGWQGAPIDVVELNGQRVVVDGHHRLAAARRAGIDVQYRVVDPSTVIGPGRYTSIDDILQSTYSVGRDRLR